MLEDESGRLRLIGTTINDELLVTGCIVAVMGTEDANGDFKVIDIKLPDLAPQPARWSLSKPIKSEPSKSTGKIAIVSGLNISGEYGSHLTLSLLAEFLLGESLTPNQQHLSSCITRLIIAGDSIDTKTHVESSLNDSKSS